MKKSSIIICVLGVVVTVGIILFFKEADRTIPNYATVIGTITSLVALSIAYFDLKETKEKIEFTLSKVNQLNSLADVSKAIKIIREIQSYLLSDKIELAHLRSTDLKHMLQYFKLNDELKEFTSEDLFDNSMMKFSMDLNSLNGLLHTPARKVNLAKVSDNLEELATFLTKFENQLKTLKYDS